jgi:hypothetical protein
LLVAGCGGPPTASEAESPCCLVVVEPLSSGEIRGVLALSAQDDTPSGNRTWLATLQGGPSVPTLEARIDEDRRFFFGPLPPGSYQLRVFDDRRRERGRAQLSLGDGDVLELKLVIEEDELDALPQK